MQLLDDYFKLQKQIYDYFGYAEEWKVLPLDDSTDMYWMLDTGSTVRYAESLEKLHSTDDQYYEAEIFTYYHLPKWVYTTDDYTMICVDTNTDGNKFLQVFDNAKRVDWPGIIGRAIMEIA